ncbi:hypothetical protein BPAE_0229g00100 [Botrytis paeoniae]|uniref:Uncharacterized protein n=1 Tax=Botrytis paeoniae TaxID=278948 RepID=A0A4Z1FDB0_9HELO|nr:hypothetical protein BPAE_0229g00100 [Botrytis paeoniae]
MDSRRGTSEGKEQKVKVAKVIFSIFLRNWNTLPSPLPYILSSKPTQTAFADIMGYGANLKRAYCATLVYSRSWRDCLIPWSNNVNMTDLLTRSSTRMNYDFYESGGRLASMRATAPSRNIAHCPRKDVRPSKV